MAKRKRTAIPDDPEGYSVNVNSGTVHTRYAGDHAGETQRTRTRRGIETLLGDADPKICRTCYPADLDSVRAGSSEPEEGQARRNG